MNDRNVETEIQEWIGQAAKYDLDLKASDFKVIDGEPTIDGMVPMQWIDAMTMD